MRRCKSHRVCQTFVGRHIFQRKDEAFHKESTTDDISKKFCRVHLRTTLQVVLAGRW